jgi:hypothetical protein
LKEIVLLSRNKGVFLGIGKGLSPGNPMNVDFPKEATEDWCQDFLSWKNYGTQIEEETVPVGKVIHISNNLTHTGC